MVQSVSNDSSVGRFYHADILAFGEAISIINIAFINLITPNLPFMESIYYLPIKPLNHQADT